MSGTNSLQAPSAPVSSGPNPLTAGPQNVPGPQPGGSSGVDSPQFHAQAGQQIAGMGMDPKALAKEASLATYASNIFGALAKDPKAKAKDVVAAAAQAVADGKTDAEGAIKLLTQMPTDKDKLGPWLRNMYLSNLTAAVHVKAEMMRQGIPVPAEKAPRKKRA